MKKIILDACCGGRMFWFNKKHPNALYIDRRVIPPEMVGKGKNARIFSVLPDIVMDFRNLKIKDSSYSLVVFDPPHISRTSGKKSYMARKYGTLEKETWESDLKQGFKECFRVLKNNGILIFKWCEVDIRLKEILKLTPYPPLFGHPSGKASKTHWVTFIKL